MRCPRYLQEYNAQFHCTTYYFSFAIIVPCFTDITSCMTLLGRIKSAPVAITGAFPGIKKTTVLALTSTFTLPTTPEAASSSDCRVVVAVRNDTVLTHQSGPVAAVDVEYDGLLGSDRDNYLMPTAARSSVGPASEFGIICIIITRVGIQYNI